MPKVTTPPGCIEPGTSCVWIHLLGVWILTLPFGCMNTIPTFWVYEYYSHLLGVWILFPPFGCMNTIPTFWVYEYYSYLLGVWILFLPFGYKRERALLHEHNHTMLPKRLGHLLCTVSAGALQRQPPGSKICLAFMQDVIFPIINDVKFTAKKILIPDYYCAIDKDLSRGGLPNVSKYLLEKKIVVPKISKLNLRRKFSVTISGAWKKSTVLAMLLEVLLLLLLVSALLLSLLLLLMKVLIMVTAITTATTSGSPSCMLIMFSVALIIIIIVLVLLVLHSLIITLFSLLLLPNGPSSFLLLLALLLLLPIRMRIIIATTNWSFFVDVELLLLFALLKILSSSLL